MFKKLGTQIVFITVLIVVAVVAALLTITLVLFGNYSDSLLLDRAHVGMEVLESTVQNEIGNLEDNFLIFSENETFTSAAAEGNAGTLDQIYNARFGSNQDFFMIIGDQNNNIIYKSSSCPLTTVDLAAIANGKTIDGILQRDGELVAMYATAFRSGDQSFGAMIGFSMEASDWMNEVKKQVDCEVTVFNNNIRYSSTFDSSVIGTPMDESIRKVVIDGKTAYSGQTKVNGVEYYISYEPMYDYSGALVGAYAANSDATEANNEFGLVTGAALAIGITGAAAIAIFLFIFCQTRVAKPLAEAEKYAEEMLAGQLNTTNVTYKFHDDEVGKFVEVLRSAKHGMNDVVGDSSRILAAMAQGDFTETPAVTYPGVFDDIEKNIMKIEDDLGQTLSRMNMSSDEVLTGSNQMAEGSQSLADGTTRQASAIEEISATIAEVSTQISNTAQNAARAGDLSSQTQEKVNYQDSEITSMVNAMNEISETSKEIGNIIKTIEDIAFQTNILALNAAVEAARAGDAGKGFAVVADEVRNLSGKSDEAAKSTSTLIHAAIEAVDKGSKIAFATAESMKEVKAMSSETAELIQQIAQASAEQTESIRQITTGVEQISQVIQTNSATAEETAASCEELSGQSKLLKDQVARFKINA